MCAGLTFCANKWAAVAKASTYRQKYPIILHQFSSKISFFPAREFDKTHSLQDGFEAFCPFCGKTINGNSHPDGRGRIRALHGSAGTGVSRGGLADAERLRPGRGRGALDRG